MKRANAQWHYVKTFCVYLTQVGQEIGKVRRQITWALMWSPWVHSKEEYAYDCSTDFPEEFLYLITCKSNKRFSRCCQATNMWTDIRISFPHRAFYFCSISKAY